MPPPPLRDFLKTGRSNHHSKSTVITSAYDLPYQHLSIFSNMKKVETLDNIPIVGSHSCHVTPIASMYVRGLASCAACNRMKPCPSNFSQAKATILEWPVFQPYLTSLLFQTQ